MSLLPHQVNHVPMVIRSRVVLQPQRKRLCLVALASIGAAGNRKGYGERLR